MTPVILVAMTARDAAEHEVFEQLAADRDGTQVAYLQVGDPSLSRVLTQAAGSGANRIILVGAGFGPSVTARSWLRRVAAHWLREQEGPTPELLLAPRTLRTPDSEALEELIEMGRADGRRVTGKEATLMSAAWEDIPVHRHQVFVCRGPRCTAKGGDATAEALVAALDDRGLGDDDVLVTQTGCQFPCNHAPLVSVQPDDIWYGRVTPEIAAAIVADHLVDGSPVAAARLSRRRGGTQGSASTGT